MFRREHYDEGVRRKQGMHDLGMHAHSRISGHSFNAEFSWNLDVVLILLRI